MKIKDIEAYKAVVGRVSKLFTQREALRNGAKKLSLEQLQDIERIDNELKNAREELKDEVQNQTGVRPAGNVFGE